MMLTQEQKELRSRLVEKLKPAFKKNDKKPLVKNGVCNKRKFSKKEAETILNFIKHHRSRNNKRRKEERYYHCPICNTYHLTKQK